MNDLYTPLYYSEMLTLAGETLFGQQWHAQMAQELGLSSTQRIYQWLAGEIAIPLSVMSDLRRIVRRKQDLMKLMEKTLDNTLLTVGYSNVVSLQTGPSV